MQRLALSTGIQAICVVTLLQAHGLQPLGLLCLWDSLGKNTVVGCHFLLQGIFLTARLNPHLLHWRMDSLTLSHLGSPGYINVNFFAGEGVEKREPSYTVGGVQPLWRTVWRFLKKLEIELPYDPAIPLFLRYIMGSVIRIREK